MNRIIIINYLMLQVFTVGMSQDVKEKSFNKNCKCAATKIESILDRFKKGSTPTENQIVNHLISPQERIDFLNSDFKTKNFSTACEVKCTDFELLDGGHLGVVDIGLRDNDRKKCMESIKSSHRTNFKTKVRTKFKVFEWDSELVIIYSETPNDGRIKELFESIE